MLSIFKKLTGIQPEAVYEPVVESGYLPDIALRAGIRALLARRKASLQYKTVQEQDEAMVNYIHKLKETKEIAIKTKEANEQHYEVPSEFFVNCLGKRLKYSSCLFETGAKNLDEAEEAMLDLYCQRAQIEDGMHVLDLGCGWGSLCLYLAKRYPECTFSALSNSNGQREYIEKMAVEQNLKNLTVHTGDVNSYSFKKKFDRIISIEMFEHMKNYKSLFKKVASWLSPHGMLFTHVFCHESMPYDFVNSEDNSWMARYFFTGGTMPSKDMFMWFQDDLTVINRWIVNGKNYGQTSEEWLKLMDKNKKKIMECFNKAYGSDASVWFQRWRMFYLACAETFNYNNGQEWMVVHYLFQKK